MFIVKQENYQMFVGMFMYEMFKQNIYMRIRKKRNGNCMFAIKPFSYGYIKHEPFPRGILISCEEVSLQKRF